MLYYIYYSNNTDAVRNMLMNILDFTQNDKCQIQNEFKNFLRRLKRISQLAL